MFSKTLISPDIITLGLKAKNQEEVLIYLGEKLKRKGYVKESFLNALIAREKEYPTGLGRLAIPHTDREHTLKDAIAIATLTRPVEFKMMDDEEKSTLVSAIFMLALSSNSQQIDTLKTLMSLVQDDSKLNAVMQCKDSQIAYQLLT